MVEFRSLTPPSSRGPGRSPFKAKTGVRISVEAQNRQTGGFFIEFRGKNRISHRSRISVEAQNRQTGGFFIEFGSAQNLLIDYLGF